MESAFGDAVETAGGGFTSKRPFILQLLEKNSSLALWGLLAQFLFQVFHIVGGSRGLAVSPGENLVSTGPV